MTTTGLAPVVTPAPSFIRQDKTVPVGTDQSARSESLSKTNEQPGERTAYRVYYVLADSRHTPFDRVPRDSDSTRRFQLTSSNLPMLSVSAHRTRKALAVMLEKFVARGVLTPEDVDDILLAAVDYQEPGPQRGPRG